MRRLAVCLVLAAGLVAWPGVAQARSGSCLIPGAELRCSIWTGRVTSVGDGDTFYVYVSGARRVYKVRITGINAMEQTVYTDNPAARRGECHALEATARLEQLIRRGGGRVRLAALDASSASHRRWRRSVAVKINGRWRDVGRTLISEGHAVWLPNWEEWAWNASYSRLAERAAAAHRGIWNPTYCGRGPSDASPLRLTVNGDADGTDDDNENGEWIRIRNLDPVRTVRLGGWMVSDSTPTNRYRLPDWVTVTPGETLTIRVGRGTDTWTELFWGLRKSIFDNERTDHGLGDGAYLFDPQGDLRAWMTYPCRLGCRDPLARALELSARGTGRESVTVRNAGATAVDLDGYRLVNPPHVYPFGIGTTLAPGKELTVQSGGDPEEDTPLVKYWGKAGAILRDAGDVVRLTSLRDVEVACVAYGDATCGQ
jgi:endonuclease YncB( thermonuclease family)